MRPSPLLPDPGSGPQAGRLWRCRGGWRHGQTRLLLESPQGCQADGRAQGTELRGPTSPWRNHPLNLLFLPGFHSNLSPEMALRSPRVTSPSWFHTERWPSVALGIPGTLPGAGGGGGGRGVGRVSRKSSQAVTGSDLHSRSPALQSWAGASARPSLGQKRKPDPHGGGRPPRGRVSGSQKEHQPRGCQNCAGRRAQDQGLRQTSFFQMDLLIRVRKILEDRVC